MANNNNGNDRREFDDRDEGNRWGDQPRGGDRGIDYQTRNQAYSPGRMEDRQAFATDDRFTGRGGDDYLSDHRGDNRSFRSRDYGPSESERGAWTTSTRSQEHQEIRSRPGQHRGKGPRGYARSDERIKENVSEVLADDAHIDASNIDVAVSGGVVTLSGTVSDRATKRMAEEVIEHLSGVIDVKNHLDVAATAGRFS